MNRRSFLGKIAHSWPLLSLPQKTMANSEDLQIAAIGVGGKGGSDLQHLARHGKLIAACDISKKKLDYALKNYPLAAKFSDYREMISHMGDKIDVLSISSPDHTHAHAAQLAIECGIHLFVQEPLAHTLWEVRQILKSAKEKKICTQTGLQGCASDNFRQAIEYLRCGELGLVQEVHVWTNRPIWPQSPVWTNRPSDQLPIPKDLFWDGFIGPAEMRPYHKIYQPYNWRGWRAFGSGALGDTGVHLFNLPVMGCGLTDVQQVDCLIRGPANLETFSSWGIVKYLFSRGESGTRVPMYWYEGRIGHSSYDILGKKNIPPIDLFLGRTPSPNGCLIIGSKGTLHSPSIFGTKWEVHKDRRWWQSRELTLPDSKMAKNGRGDAGMKEELVQAIRSGKEELAMANFSYSAQINELTMLGNISLLAGGEFEWDSNLYLSNRTDVNKWLTKSYREGWAVNAA